MKRALTIAVGLALLVSLQTMRLGLFLDDYKLFAHVDGLLPQARPLDYYSFARDPAELQALISRGPYPWWTLPNLKLAFFRPLSSALMLLDRQLFGDAYWAFHLH